MTPEALRAGGAPPSADPARRGSLHLARSAGDSTSGDLKQDRARGLASCPRLGFPPRGLSLPDLGTEHRRGVARVGTAIARELLARGFEQFELHRINATCDPRNLGSARVLGKLGMTGEGRHRHTALIRDGWRDSEMFSILEEEWRGSDGRDAGSLPPPPGG
ncbi:GNAT family protein [Streptomyces sp. NPDC089919]|uniref:GNAT family N-acetyltransferase n=1 Tax=Streptomyces sp. NPDC089919 TaxID=3155188 RepID=UPI003428D432